MDAQRKGPGARAQRKGMVEHGMRDRGQGEGGRPMRSARRNGAAEAVVGRKRKKTKY